MWEHTLFKELLVHSPSQIFLAKTKTAVVNPGGSLILFTVLITFSVKRILKMYKTY